ncbi:MAG TPA: MgtC/SapB family protein [Gallionellaceae bacterium]|nr:MgtC/SapB family protein [Gallionellaceae bacterium]
MENSFLQINGIEALPQFLTSLAIGLLIGLERERNPSAKAGLRTFALVALFGTLVAMLSSKTGSPWLLAAGLLVVGAMIIAAYFSNPGEELDPGTTTVAALLLCYGLGALVWYGQAQLAVMLAVTITILLYFKPELRGMTQRLTRRDLVSVLQFLVLTFVVLPVLPDQSYGPYGAFNPHQTWLMVVLISGLSLAGYVALQWTGHRYGPPLLGFLGGLVSSTATTLAYAKHGRNNESMVNLSAAVILIASQVVLLRLLVVSSVISPALLPALLRPLGIGLAFGIVAILINWRRLRSSADLPRPSSSNPTEIPAALGFALMYVVVLLGAAWLSDVAGNKGLFAVAAISGLTDVDAITLSSLRLYQLGSLHCNDAVMAIAIAFLSNMLLKFGMVFFIAGRSLARQVLSGFAAMSAGVALGLALL